MSEAVAARVNEQVAEWIEERADKTAKTKGRIVEETLREAYLRAEREGQDQETEELPEGVYVPDSDKYNYAVKFENYNGETRRKYYKSREGAVEKASREFGAGLPDSPFEE